MISKKNIEDLVYSKSKLYKYPSLEFINSLYEISDASNAGLLNPELGKRNAAELYNIIFNNKQGMSENLRKSMAINVYFSRGDIKHNIYAIENEVIFEYTYYIDMTWEMIEKQYNIKKVGDKLRIKDLHNGTQWHAPYKLTGLYRIDSNTINKLKLLGANMDSDTIEKLNKHNRLIKIDI